MLIVLFSQLLLVLLVTVFFNGLDASAVFAVLEPIIAFLDTLEAAIAVIAVEDAATAAIAVEDDAIAVMSA